MATVKTIQQLTESEADTGKVALQAFYADEGIDGDYIAKDLQIDAWTFCGIPLARSAEFDAASIEDKSKFAIISALAHKPEHADVTYAQAWEAEYLIMFP